MGQIEGSFLQPIDASLARHVPNRCTAGHFCVLQKPGRYIFGKGLLYGGGKSLRVVK